MRLILLGLPALAMATACAGGASSVSPSTELPRSASAGTSIGSDAAKAGIYASAYLDTSVFAFKSKYKGGRGPVCTIYTGYSYINGIAADPKGNLILPLGSPAAIDVYSGPGLCGSKLGHITDPYGQPAAAASFDAANGTIAVADLTTGKKAVGNIAVCTLAGGCTQELTNSNVTGFATGVALAKNGDCWLDSENAGSSGAALTYWAGCTGSGEATTGFQNTSFGGLSIDKSGNILAIDSSGGGTGQLWVYSGCNPACTVVGGPFALKHSPFYGALNAKGDTFGVMEDARPYGGEIDIYKYTPTKLTYKYSFNSGFEEVAYPEGIAFSPALSE